LANHNRISGWPEFRDGAAGMVEAREQALIAHPPVVGFDLGIFHGLSWRNAVPSHSVKLHEGTEVLPAGASTSATPADTDPHYEEVMQPMLVLPQR
jgi:hypothetical protein